jgi:hypothetical protein
MIMLTFAQKLEIMQSYSQLERRDVSLGRVNFHFEHSVYEKTTVGYHFHPNGNGYIYGGLLTEYAVNEKGLVNIRDFTAEQLHTIVQQSIASLSPASSNGEQEYDESNADLIDNDDENDENNEGTTANTEASEASENQQLWTNSQGEVLSLTYEAEQDLWYLYSGASIEMVFESQLEAEDYLEEEGFSVE